MAKKTKSSYKKKVQSPYTPVSQALQWTIKIQEELLQENYEAVIEECERLLSYVPTLCFMLRWKESRGACALPILTQFISSIKVYFPLEYVTSERMYV